MPIGVLSSYAELYACKRTAGYVNPTIGLVFCAY